MVSLEKWLILTPLQKLHKNRVDWDKLIVVKGLKKVAQSPINRPIWSCWSLLAMVIWPQQPPCIWAKKELFLFMLWRPNCDSSQCDQIWQNYKHLVTRFVRIVSIVLRFFRNWQNFKPPLWSIFAIEQVFIIVNGQILNKSYSHLVTLPAFEGRD